MSASARRGPLPRGPHGLSRDEVSRSQRARLLTGMTAAVAEKGYANTVVADVVARSGVSRATFYKMFRDKEDCFQAAYEATAAVVAQVLEVGLHDARTGPDRSPVERLDYVLGLYLAALASAPDLARVFLVEVYAAGPVAIRQRRDSLDQFVDIVAATHAGETGVLGTRPEQRFAVEAIVGAVSSMVTTLVGVGEIDRLPELRAPLMKLAREILGASQL
ncbi:MAG TPA: TetR/AcrR family transcriptional regulator [Acidimicrobiales bacterium]|nr:TetR/AcrR family transcriptional regulator [Acidimicrobiales bacterium]